MRLLPVLRMEKSLSLGVRWKRQTVDRLKSSLVIHGSGLTEDVAQRMFEPLFTTKQQGAGLGIAIAQSRSFDGVTFRHRFSLQEEPTPAGAQCDILR
jgi:C4-dicarboxylate-specific signal transduction histidine kinase